jgi:murein DD-endopeptidase MepM/ murein hydrolase activator NlpD
MKLKPTDISTVIIVNKNQQSTKTLQIKTKHLSRIRHYAASIAGVILILSCFIIYLRSQNQKQEAEKLQLISQIDKLKGIIPAALPQAKEAAKGNSAQAYVQSIQSKLQKLNDYLKNRGIKGFSTQNVGGGENAEGEKLSDKEVYTLYDEYLNRLLHTVTFTPFGYPRISAMTSVFGYRSDPFNSEHAEYHPGIDFKGARGDEAKCTAHGKVVFAGRMGGYGNCVRIAHANNFETLYGHLSRITVRVGQVVEVGEKIGEVGSTGRSTGTHLHYEVRKNGKAINPVKFLTLKN